MAQDYKNEDLKTVKEHENFNEKKGSNKPIDEVMNGSMAPNLDEVKRLGKDMKGMKTGQELKKEGLVPDPVQSE